MASGLGSLAIYLGIFAGLALTPYLTIHSSIGSVLVAYGIVSVIAAVAFFGLIRERPPTPPSFQEETGRTLVLDGLRSSLRHRDFVLVLIVFFVGLGVFNAVTTWIEAIVRPRGFSATQAGVAGGLMIVGGIAGAAGSAGAIRPPAAQGPVLERGFDRCDRGSCRRHVCGALPVSARLSLCNGFLPVERWPDRVSVRRGGHLPGTRRHIERADPARGADIGDRLHPRHG